MIARWFKKRAIKSYGKRLPRLLLKDYGGSDAYTPAQILASIARHGLNRTHAKYAVAMFSDREAFEKTRAEFGFDLGYDALRQEVSDRYFSDDSWELSTLNSDVSAGFNGSDFGSGGHHNA